MQLEKIAQSLLEELKLKWLHLAANTNVFAYSLNVTKQKWLSERQLFYAELNAERSALRRQPQQIATLSAPFDESKFSFKHIGAQELLASVPYQHMQVSIIINKSPLTLFHMLICPDVSAGLPQRLTLSSLSFCVEFLQYLNDNAVRIGFNSPGALASVNHLHLHISHIDLDLYTDKAKLVLLVHNFIFRLSEDMPTEAICYLFRKADGESEMAAKLKNLYDFINWLCNQNWPHNIWMTRSRACSEDDTVKVFVYARAQYCVIKELGNLNIGCYEYSGFVPIGNKEVFDDLTEQDVISKIRQESGHVYAQIYDYFNDQKLQCECA